jgi:hypothetical protein
MEGYQWLVQEQAKIGYMAQKLDKLRCNADPAQWPEGVKIWGVLAKRRTTVYAACEDDPCVQGYAIKQRKMYPGSSITAERLGSIFAVANALIERGISPHFVYIYRLIVCPLAGGQLASSVPEVLTVEERERLERYVNVSIQFGHMSQEDAERKAVKEIWPDFAGYAYILSEKGVPLAPSLINKHFGDLQVYSLVFFMFQSLLALGAAGYRFDRPQIDELVWLELPHDSYFSYQVLGKTYHVPTFGQRLAWVSLDLAHPMTKARSIKQFIVKVLTELTRLVSDVPPELVTPELIQALQDNIAYLHPEEPTAIILEDVPILRTFARMFSQPPEHMHNIARFPEILPLGADSMLGPPTPSTTTATPLIQPFTTPSTTPLSPPRATQQPLQQTQLQGQFTPLRTLQPAQTVVVRSTQPFNPTPFNPQPFVRTPAVPVQGQRTFVPEQLTQPITRSRTPGRTYIAPVVQAVQPQLFTPAQAPFTFYPSINPSGR